MKAKIIYLHILKRLTAAVALAGLLLSPACTEERLWNEGDCPEGQPATLTVRLDPGQRTNYTRGDLQPGQDNIITSLWVAVYNVRTGARTGVVKLNETHNIPDHTYNEKLTIPTLSGESYVVAVANYDHRRAQSAVDGDFTSVAEALDAADTWEKYCDIAIFFDDEGTSYIEAPANALVMSGYYVAKDDAGHSGMPAMSTVDIQPGASSPVGAVHLRRVISQVKFNVTFNDENVKSGSVTSWTVSNLPSNCWLHERTDGDLNSFDTRKASGTSGYNSSGRNTTISSSGTTYSFDFWQLENKRTGNDNAKDYASREKEFKNDDGTNSGKYVSLVDAINSTDPNNNATFVSFHVVMELKVDENGNSLSGTNRRLVEADYVVHLGYVNNNDKAKDFSCLRNSRYTYTVTVNNVNDLVVEARRENAIEQNPAVNGTITDVTDSYYELDAHYCALNVYLRSTDFENFQYYIEATRLNGSTITIDSQVPSSIPASGSDDYKYLSWIEFRYVGNTTNDEKKLADYKPASDAETYTLEDMRNKKTTTAGYYTIFVNEYVYENAEVVSSGDESKSTNWKNYVNRPPRRMWLLVQRGISSDTETKHFESKLAISQKSIQCYYDVNAAGLTSALALEHTNETLGLALRNDFNPKKNAAGTDISRNSTGRNHDAGRWNLAQYITGSTGNNLTWNNNNRYRWSTYLDLNDLQNIPAVNNQGVVLAKRTEYLPNIKTQNIQEYNENNYNQAAYDPSSEKIQAIRACMNRNRDLNGDGIIDKSELRWYVPTSTQYLRMILGRNSLEDPLFAPVGITRIAYPNLSNSNSRYMFYASDGRVMWLMEGTSWSIYRNNTANTPSPWEVRCARNLGSNMSNINNTAASTPAFRKINGRNIIDVSLFDDKSLRQEAYHGPMPVHQINDQHYNRCYRAFEYKSEVIPLNSDRLTGNLAVKSTETWSDYLNRANPCDIYNTGGETGWRVPNQKELAIMGMVGVYNESTNSTTLQSGCSFSFFDFSGYAPGQNPNDPVAGGSITTQYRYEMKLRSGDGVMTQIDMRNQNINTGYYGVRCVRDYSGTIPK